MRAEKNRPANSSDDWTSVITCAWHHHKSQTADNTWAENYWKITRHYTTHACCYNRKTGLDLIVSHFEITVHIGHYTHKWILNIKIKHSMTFGHYTNNLCDKLSQKGEKNPYTLNTLTPQTYPFFWFWTFWHPKRVTRVTRHYRQKVQFLRVFLVARVYSSIVECPPGLFQVLYTTYETVYPTTIVYLKCNACRIFLRIFWVVIHCPYSPLYCGITEFMKSGARKKSYTFCQ